MIQSASLSNPFLITEMNQMFPFMKLLKCYLTILAEVQEVQYDYRYPEIKANTKIDGMPSKLQISNLNKLGYSTCRNNSIFTVSLQISEFDSHSEMY